MTEMDELAAALSLEIAEAVMGNPTVEAVFCPDDLDGFKSDIQIEAVRVLNSHFARSRPSLSPAGVTEEQVEAAARVMATRVVSRVATAPGAQSMVERGWVIYADDARAALEAAAKAQQPRDYTDFDTWFHEQEGVSLRSERFNGDVEWLKAAFDAGRSAQPSISTGQGEPVAVPLSLSLSLSLSGEAREAVLSYRCRLRVAFRRALSDLPEIAPPEVSEVLSSIHMQDRFLDEGRRLQRLYGLTAVSPRLEQECGAGAWSFIRRGLLDSRPLPAGHVAVPVEPTEEMMKAMGDAFFDAAIGHVAGDLASVNEPFRRFYRAMLAARPHNQGEGK